MGCAPHRFAPRPCWPPTAPTLRKARALSRPRARLEWLGTASSTEVAPTACQKSFWGRRATGRAKLCTAGSRRKLPPPLGGAGRRRSGGPGTGRYPGGPIQLRLRRGAGRERWCAYEQSRNVLSFHGHYARDSTFYQGFRLRTGGGGSGSRSGCNDLATGSRRRQVGVMQGEDLLGTPPRGSWLEQLLAPAALPLPPAQPLGACPISRDCCCHPTSRTSNARTDAGNHAKPRTPAFTSRTRESGIGAAF